MTGEGKRDWECLVLPKLKQLYQHMLKPPLSPPTARSTTEGYAISHPNHFTYPWLLPLIYWLSLVSLQHPDFETTLGMSDSPGGTQRMELATTMVTRPIRPAYTALDAAAKAKRGQEAVKDKDTK